MLQARPCRLRSVSPRGRGGNKSICIASNAGLHGSDPTDDNFAFIDRLLDTLQAETHDEDSDRKDLARDHDSSCELAACGSELVDLQQASVDIPVRADAGVSLEDEWSSLMSRFCESGDESIVDTLLDNFLRSTSNAANLIEAIGKTSSEIPDDLCGKGKFHLDLKGVRQADAPCLDHWEALLSSARGILQSARTSKSPQSMGSLAADSPNVRSPASVAPKGRRLLEEPGEGEERVDIAASAQLVAGSGPAVGRVELLAKLASQDNPEEVRSFLRNFLIGVRQRCLVDISEQVTDSEDEIEDDDASDYASPIWTCRSIDAETPDQCAGAAGGY